MMALLSANAAVVSALTALAAVIVGPLVTLYVARRQINAQVVSANRQAWINNLRAAVSGFLTEMATDETKQRDPDAAMAAAHKKVRSLSQYVTDIALLINPNEDLHQELLRLVRIATADFKEKLSDPTVNPMRYRKETIDVAQRIFKEEWNRVKAGR